MRIMTINIWGNYFGNPSEERIDAIELTLRKYDADVIGVQEMCVDWYKSDLCGRLDDKYVAVCGYKGNYSPLFFKRDIFEIAGMGWFRYKDTPDISKSVTWAVLERKEDGRKIGVCNTHLWWMQRGEEDDVLRVQNAGELLGLMKEIKEKYGDIPVLAFGDFNCNEKSNTFKFLNENDVFSSYMIAEKFSSVSSHHGNPVRDENGIYRGKKAEKDMSFSIDHIVTFRNEIKITEQCVVEDQEILDSTDHSPVYIDFEF